jgi:uncharacterized DUF497 family protein
MDFSGFDWDAGNRVKCQQHGVSLDEIEYVLRHGAVAPDLVHSIAEQRFIAVGRTEAGRAVFVAFTIRVRDQLVLARPFSARYMHAKEALRYGQ